MNMAAVVLRSLQRSTAVGAVLNVTVAVLGTVLLALLFHRCGEKENVPLVLATVGAALKIVSMVGSAVAQVITATATTVAGRMAGDRPVNEEEEHDLRQQRKRQYKRWIWWTRFGTAVSVLQLVAAIYLTVVVAKDFSHARSSLDCLVGKDAQGWIKPSFVSFVVLVWLVVMIHCITGSDVLRWRSFYAAHDTAWKAYYREVYDHGIREALCCLGRIKYLRTKEEDEIYSVAKLLGDFVSYRALGTEHLELFAGFALLQRHKKVTNLYGELMSAPESHIREASALHQFAEAAYTGPLLDFGRNSILFPCAWLYRQGLLTLWTIHRRPEVEGDNWWRGHAAAFLKFVNLSPEALRKGRVCQTNREAAYFVVVLHDVRTVVIAVRGTETPEDLITDGLCTECTLSEEDLDGLINSDQLSPGVRQSVLSSFPHYGHSGIVESAREHFMKIDGVNAQHGEKGPNHNPFGNSVLKTSGFLSSLLGVGCECHGYKVRIVGHSVGGAIATLLGIRLYRHYPSLHVYAYGTPPCLDSVIAEACSDFITTIVYNDEYSARLSINSIVRLRDAAINALMDKSNKFSVTEGSKHIYRKQPLKNKVKGGAFLCGHMVFCLMNMPTHRPCLHPMDECKLSSPNTLEPRNSDGQAYIFPDQTTQSDKGLPQAEISLTVNLGSKIVNKNANEHENPENTKESVCECNDIDNETCFDSTGNITAFLDNPSTSAEVSSAKTAELFLPGLIIHIVPEHRSCSSICRSWRIYDRKPTYKAFIANRESFKDIIITPYMFLDHMPWRCQYAMQRALETRNSQGQMNAAVLNGDQMV